MRNHTTHDIIVGGSVLAWIILGEVTSLQDHEKNNELYSRKWSGNIAALIVPSKEREIRGVRRDGTNDD